MKSVNDRALAEGLNFQTVADRLNWHLRGDVTTNLGTLLQSFIPGSHISGGAYEFWGSHRLLDQAEGGWLDPWELFDRDGSRLRPGIVRSRLQQKLNGYLGDVAILQIWRDPDTPPAPLIRGSLYLQNIHPILSPGARDVYHLRLYDGNAWLTLYNDALLGVCFSGDWQP
jgi:hypothetical protein